MGAAPRLSSAGSAPRPFHDFEMELADARYEKARVGHRIVSQGLGDLGSARGRLQGMVGITVADTESEST